MSTPDTEPVHPPVPPPDSPATPDPAPPPVPRRPAASWRRLRFVGLAALILVILAGGGLVGAEYYTSRPAFCGQCHIMGSYYQSWSRDLHATKLGARCVDCHYAPGEQHTIHAKFRGLSQVTSYFSGRYGATRPRAHVNDASCLTGPCHGDRAFMPTALLIGEPRKEKRLIGTEEIEVERIPTVQFVHKKHLDIGDKQAENDAQLSAVRARLEQAGPDAYARLHEVAVSVTPVVDRTAHLRAVLKELGIAAYQADADELVRLEHWRTRLLQLANLNCAACHSYDASGQRHLSLADLQVCFTCHFNNVPFNQDTGECLRCHQPPQRKIIIHDQSAVVRGVGATTAAAGPILMDHRDIVASHVDCSSCHFDVVQGQAAVTTRDCANCHDQQKYLADFDRRDTEVVAEYHRVHVAAQRARCGDCHRAIQHRLVDPTHVGTTGGFLQPVLNDCRHCHPNHHHEQIELLLGTGGVGIPAALPNAMVASRLNCTACHTKPASDIKGDELIESSQATCIACHGSDYERLFQQWMDEISTYLREAEATLARVSNRVDELRAEGRDVPDSVIKRIAEARQNVQLIRSGNGIHNKNYALELLDLSVQGLDQAMTTLMGP